MRALYGKPAGLRRHRIMNAQRSFPMTAVLMFTLALLYWPTLLGDQAHAGASARTHATAKITVQSSEASPYDRNEGPALMEMRLTERFAGDIDGQATVRALEMLRGDRSASLVSEQRFRGRVGGREGTFVLQGQEIVSNGKVEATWFVVPGSGTGDLVGLRGEGGFEGGFGKGSEGTLDYWFE
jgi:hypothetical protein